MGSITPDSTPYGRRLIPPLIDEIAEHDPDRVFACIPKTTDLKDGFQDVTFADFARAINRAAGWIEKTLGQSHDGKFETLAYMGPFDLRYYVMIVAACKLGYKVGDFSKPMRLGMTC
jgi:acyl-coenzyme A synthetase/AMP-(fatty) acid ligase